jgi:Mitochondrial biogenesis AIM24
MVMVEPSVKYEVKMQSGLKQALGGGEGVFLVHMTGPGQVTLQTLPFSRTARRVLEAAPWRRQAERQRTAWQPTRRIGGSDGVSRQGEGGRRTGRQQGEGGRAGRPDEARARSGLRRAGQKTHELVESGAVSHPDLTPLVDKISALKAQDEQEGEPVGATSAASSTEPPPSNQPPAMPT